MTEERKRIRKGLQRAVKGKSFEYRDETGVSIFLICGSCQTLDVGGVDESMDVERQDSEPVSDSTWFD